jgi:hypothetical protein
VLDGGVGVARKRKEAHETPFTHAREQGFKGQVRLGGANPFDYHTEICHVLADKLKDG